MKKILLAMVLLATVATVARAQSAAAKLAANGTPISLADARGKIDKAIESPAVMGELMKRLSAEDQKRFLADVNKAIGELPASIEEKSAKFLNINHVAVKFAKKGNTTALLAEVFATVPPEALTVINERFAQDLLNRAANPNITYTDEQFTKIAVETMKEINERTEETDNGSARSTFAALMFLRASNMTGAPLEKLQDALVDTLKHDDAKELAKDEWIPAALGKGGREAGYEPILASADAGRRPDFDFVRVIAGPQYLDSILQDIGSMTTDKMSFTRTRSPVLDAVQNPLIHQIPTLDGDLPAQDITPPESHPEPPPEPHPGPYQGQNSSWRSKL